MALDIFESLVQADFDNVNANRLSWIDTLVLSLADYADETIQDRSVRAPIVGGCHGQQSR